MILFFYPDIKNLSKTYDFIICCEVMEHFFDPEKEFTLLKSLLKPSGKLFCKTSILKNDADQEYFNDWWYHNDPTHVFFYTPKTLHYIAENFGFNQVKIEPKLITFS